jgi:hypothetical protein
MQPLVTVWCSFGCVLQLCSVVTVVTVRAVTTVTELEDATETTPHGEQRLHVQKREAPDDGHSGVENMLSNVE